MNIRNASWFLFRKNIFILFVLFFISCVTTNSALIGEKRKSISPENVKIYRSFEKVSGKYEEVAILESKGDYEFNDLEDFFDSMKEEAAKLGANGVVLQSINDPTKTEQILDALFDTGIDREIRSIAIYVFESK